MLYTDIRAVKAILQIPSGDTSEDVTLLYYIDWATSIVEEYLGRDVTLKPRVQYYKGSGHQKLLLRNRPVYPSALVVVEDEAGYFGASPGSFGNSPTARPLTYGVDYTLQIDMDDGGSRSGILWRINNYWARPSTRQVGLLSAFVSEDPGSYQVTYTAGWTVDTLPGAFRTAANLLVARMRYLFPLGMELNSDSYEDRNIGMNTERKDYLLALVKPLLFGYRNWRF